MAITQSQYTAPDKVQGDIFFSTEHNEMKSVLNQKTDADNAILIEGNQSILGDLTLTSVISGLGTFSDQVSITKAANHIQFISPRTDNNTSLDRTTLVMTDADSALDFYVYSVTDSVGRFSVSTAGSGWFANQLETNGTLTINHRAVLDDPKAIIIHSGETPTTSTSTPTDIIWNRKSKEAARVRFDDKFDMYLAVINNSNILTNRVGLGSQTGTGLTHGVTLYDGDTSVKSLHTITSGIVVPSTFVDGAGVTISSLTSTGAAGSLANSSGSVFFKEKNDGKEGISLDYFGDTVGDFLGNRLYINRYNNSTTPLPIIRLNKTDSNIIHYGGLVTTLENADASERLYQWMSKDVGVGAAQGKLLLRMDGPTIIHAGDSGNTVMDNLPVSTEVAAITSDGNVVFYTNLQNGWASKKTMTFATNGDLTVEGAVYATNFQFTSDISLKENIKPLTTSIDIDFIEFNFKNSNKQRYGVSAQEVQKVLPELVSEDNEGNLTVAMIDFLVLKVAELERKIKEFTK